DMVLARLLSPATLYKLLQFESYDPQHAYTAGEMLKNLQSGIFKELKSGKSINVYRRNLQKSYVEKLMAMLAPPQPNQR
ncbi:zinc-dependent metalloprotease, partial [Salmonella enterica]|uniref:zinc-dependent metalloprotease n=1 Tax=Salmonella enterica TaxID=28901 RepID=UPI0020C55DF9